MSIRQGNNEEIGGIKYLGPRDSSTEDINSVWGQFHRDERLIWPTVSKYVMFITDKNFYRNGEKTFLTCDSCETSFKLYIRSCTRFFDKKYPLRATSPSTWIKVNGQSCGIGNDIDVACNNYDCDQDSPDGDFSITVSANASPFERSTRILLYQVDDLQGNVRTGKYYEIVVTQNGDHPDKDSINYNNIEVAWFSDESYLDKVSSYGTKKSPIVSVNGGSFNVFFSIYLNVKMVSGFYSRTYYGDNGESIDGVNLVCDGGTVSNVKYDGGGMWRANVTLNKTLSSESTVTPEITNLTCSDNGTVGYSGGTVVLTWKTYANVVSSNASYQLKVFVDKVPGSSVSEIPCWQGGGTYYDVVDDLAQEVVIPSQYAEMMSTVGSITKDSDTGFWYQTIRVNEGKSVNNLVISNMSITQTSSSGTMYSGDNIQWNTTDTVDFAFDIIEKNGSYLERSGNVTVTARSRTSQDSKSTTITQTGLTGSGLTKVTTLNGTPMSILETPKVNDNNIFTSFTQPTYYRYRWHVYGTPRQNSPITSSYSINVFDIPLFIPSSGGSIGFTWQVSSGTRNANARTSSIAFSIPTKYLSYNANVTQGMSKIQENVTYHKDLCRNLGGGSTTLTNVTDNIVVSTNSINIQGINYYATVKVNDNKSIVDDGVAYVQPTSISTWSVGDADNFNNSSFYVAIRGRNVYKGKERTVVFKIDVSPNSGDKSSWSCNINQLANSAVADATSDVPCIGLDEDAFSVVSGSEGYMIEGSTSVVSTEAGIYKIPVHINDNTTPTQEEYLFDYDGITRHNALNVDVPNFYDKLRVPFKAWWSSIGYPVSRTITLGVMVGDEMKKLVGKWDGILYTGDMDKHSMFGEDYNLISPSGTNWITPSTSSIEFSSNDTGKVREVTSDVVYYKDDEEKKRIPIKFTQNPTTRDNNYTLSFSIDTDTWHEIDLKDQIEFNVRSYDNYDGTALSLVEDYNKDLITLYKSTSGYLTTYKIRMTNANTGDVPIKSQVKITQKNRVGGNAKTVTINLYQPSYSLSLTQDKTVVDPIDNIVKITVDSKKKIIKNGITSQEDMSFSIVQSDYNIGLLSGDGNVRYFTCQNENRSGLTRKTTLTCTQSISLLKKSIEISEGWWSENDLDTSDVDLYTTSQKVVRTFTSIDNGNPLIPKVEYLTGNLIRYEYDNQVVSKVSVLQDDTCSVEFSLKSMKEGDIPEYGIYKIYNDKWTIGKLYVRRHAFVLDASTEDNSEYVWYVSSYANTIWSLYYVYSRLDGDECEYDITTSDNYTINVKKNIVSIYSNEDNQSTEERRIGHIYVKQAISGKTITIRIEQIRRDEDYIINI